VPILENLIDEFESDNRFRVALLAVKKKEKKERQSLKVSRTAAIASVIAALVALLSLCLSNFVIGPVTDKIHPPSSTDQAAPVTAPVERPSPILEKDKQ
jgi:hypothetical protein